MQILLTGGTGFVGSELVKYLSTHQIVLLTRDISAAKKKLYHTDLRNITYIDSLDDYQDFNQFDAIINLAGEPIAGKRWSNKQKKKICQSRWGITEKLVELIHASTEPPEVFISGSAVGYYGDQQQHPFDESLHVYHEGFTHHVCSAWESIAIKAESDKTRVCMLRTGLVLGLQGGALKAMLPPFQFGMGSVLGKGDQFMPWIHIQDMVRGIVYLLETPHAKGHFNFNAPHPVTNKHFSRTLARTLRRPLFMVTPKWLFTLAMGEASCLLFDSIHSKPKRLTELGFHFNYSRLEPALSNLFHNTNYSIK
ncbi:TIGR01777 family oxidoreductase [Vibrio sp. SCSIO 43137]|uniref:TIGR01777 family oxidoreductase n=1 Tax=Vibrio sp. SCSIO 43137 TaxID=3021011 RepID=UPI002306E149|nr:TIGR01777 family oxidoreductase [Vibrio sp. SCSIO 43137]WCE30504.1 TIGR01777 family oxidoreductase [Vibrio sp. SCSIO 43137]